MCLHVALQAHGKSWAIDAAQEWPNNRLVAGVAGHRLVFCDHVLHLGNFFRGNIIERESASVASIGNVPWGCIPAEPVPTTILDIATMRISAATHCITSVQLLDDTTTIWTTLAVLCFVLFIAQ